MGREFKQIFGDGLWLPSSRLVIGAVSPPSHTIQALIHESLPEPGSHDGVAQAAYRCGAAGQGSLRGVPCRGPDLEHALLAQILLHEREASTIVLLPGAEAWPANDDGDFRSFLQTLAACAGAKVGHGFCENGGWRAVSVASLVCFSSEEPGMRLIYGCDGLSSRNVTSTARRCTRSGRCIGDRKK